MHLYRRKYCVQKHKADVRLYLRSCCYSRIIISVIDVRKRGQSKFTNPASQRAACFNPQIITFELSPGPLHDLVMRKLTPKTGPKLAIGANQNLYELFVITKALNTANMRLRKEIDMMVFIR